MVKARTTWGNKPQCGYHTHASIRTQAYITGYFRNLGNLLTAACARNVCHRSYKANAMLLIILCAGCQHITVKDNRASGGSVHQGSIHTKFSTLTGCTAWQTITINAKADCHRQTSNNTSEGNPRHKA